MKKLVMFFAGLLLITSVSGKDLAIRQKIADEYYKRYDYNRAITLYEEILKDKPGDLFIIARLADSYKKINDSGNAAHYYSILVENNPSNSEYILAYAQMLARNGNYVQASEWYDKYAKAVPADKRGQQFAEALNNLKAFTKDSSLYIVEKSPFNSDVSDFSPAYYGKQLVFSSARTRRSMVKTSYNWTNSSYLDLFIVNPDSVGADRFSPDINSSYHEGPVTFSRNLDTIIFTRSNFNRNKFGTDKEGVNRLKLYMATRQNSSGKWENITPFQYDSNEYSVGHPSLTRNGNTLYFASDMPGGFGGTDIYATHKITGADKSVTWSAPENLGNKINSEGNELFPFVDETGTLWFSSNGIAGLGGLDVFYATRTGNGFSAPVNVGYPINSRFDDFGYITENSGKDGYFSSDRSAGTGNDDIFRVHRKGLNLVIMVFDAKTGEALSSADLIVSADDFEPTKLPLDQKGQSTLSVTDAKKLRFVAEKPSYEQMRIEIPADKLSEKDTVKLGLTRVPVELKLAGNVVSAVNFLPMYPAKAIISDLAGGLKKEIECNKMGKFEFDLSPSAEYLVEVSVLITGKKCMTSKANISTKGLDKSFKFNEMFPIYCVGDIIRVENIYYDLGKADIRPEAAAELDKVYDILQKYPGMTIELRSHTDSRGSSASNLDLSQRRALSAAEYLYKKGVERKRIVYKGYGETIPVNQCTDGVKCSEADYQLNRRTEFKVLSIE